MPRPPISRREFAVLAASAAATTRYGFASLADQASVKSTITAQQVIDRIHAQARTGWPQTASAGLKAGNADVQVRGLATTAMATMDVLKQAVKSGANLILTYEPTFFGQGDGLPSPPGRGPQGGPQGGPPQGGPQGGGGRPQQGLAPTDPVLMAKKAFIEQNGLVVYRIGDHWKAGEDLSLALGATLGWSKGRIPNDPFTYMVPSRTLAEVLAEVSQKLGVRGGMRVVGDPKTKVQRIALLPGLRPLSDILKYLPQTDLVFVGETRDWEGPEYSSDANAAGMKKGYVALGRVVSEDPGMQSFAKWIQTFLKEVPVQAIAAMDPYWRPALR
jgi:putative NIF3 family GTP cyclohydrolase 1 type 2